eukprot:12318130-Alexandrium_andersonii.AAC.1
MSTWPPHEYTEALRYPRQAQQFNPCARAAQGLERQVLDTHALLVVATCAPHAPNKENGLGI